MTNYTPSVVRGFHSCKKLPTALSNNHFSESAEIHSNGTGSVEPILSLTSDTGEIIHTHNPSAPEGVGKKKGS